MHPTLYCSECAWGWNEANKRSHQQTVFSTPNLSSCVPSHDHLLFKYYFLFTTPIWLSIHPFVLRLSSPSGMVFVSESVILRNRWEPAMRMLSDYLHKFSYFQWIYYLLLLTKLCKALKHHFLSIYYSTLNQTN